MAELNVNPADLLRVADAYTELAARAALISPQAVVEVQRIADTHGLIGYPTAVGIAAGLANADGPLMAKVMDFNSYAQRFTEHAAAYTGEDAQAAQRAKSIDWPDDQPRVPGGNKDVDAAVPLDSHNWKPGDKRHMPYIAGPGGLGPANPPDGPKWVEIGPRSGNFVRSDELPGLKIQEPGGLGPAPTYDANGNRVPYIELGPGTGAWAPKSDFPGAVIIPPGSHALAPYGYREWLPGSGIYMWHDDLLPEPAQPRSPLLPPETHPAAGSCG
ncbi:hypothetical protein MSM1_20175 [Mycobacterium sp. SM1]|uniref:type VII secretion target n=1 Tax=Mycobacterium sp. SM1 TaxID=2816243 RepID=UPI001BCE37EF|nr:type VII secretion target [Mycobacterium sp. SM1]MBS4730538.1 hypothetical protein [Mycobacterium sp. SM1]